MEKEYTELAFYKSIVKPRESEDWYEKRRHWRLERKVRRWLPWMYWNDWTTSDQDLWINRAWDWREWVEAVYCSIISFWRYFSRLNRACFTRPPASLFTAHIWRFKVEICLPSNARTPYWRKIFSLKLDPIDLVSGWELTLSKPWAHW